MSMPVLPFQCPLTAQEIAARRAEALRRVLADCPGLDAAPPRRVPERALLVMLEACDACFFAGFLARHADRLTVSASTRMTRAAGTCTIRKTPLAAARVEVRMGVDFLLRMGEGPFEANGLRFPTALEAFLSVMEHELCHAADYLLHGELDCHGPRFRALSQGLFGHRRSTHALPTRAEEAVKLGVGIGQRVCFEHQGHTLCGQVTRVGKTATVMVPDIHGAWRDRRGTRYVKYTISLPLLRPADR